MQFIHGIDPKDFFPCHNLALCGKLSSPNAAALLDPGLRYAHSPIQSSAITDLRHGHPQTGVLSPRAAGEVVRGGILRASQKIMNGLGEVELMADATRDFAIRCSDAEIVFEEARRTVAPHATSRLSCLYLAERTDDGHQMLRAMLGANCYILDVRILLELSRTRADSAWFDAYVNQPDDELARNYWLGEQFHHAGGNWEYLLEGVIEVEAAAQLSHIRRYGAKVA